MQNFEIQSKRGCFASLRNNNAGAPPLLALHGWLDNAASFLPMAPHLTRYDLVAIDMPGHGRSFHYPEDAEYNIFSTLLDMLAAADALGWPRFSLLGHSLGGAVSSLLATAAPERIERLCLIEALGPLAAPADGMAERLRDALAKRRALDPARKRVFSTTEEAVRARMQTNVTSLDEASAQAIVQRGVRPVDGGYIWSSDARLTLPTAIRMTEAQIQDCLRAIECPVRIVMADPSPPYIPSTMIEARTACVRDVVCTSQPGSHHLHMTHPREVVEALAL